LKSTSSIPSATKNTKSSPPRPWRSTGKYIVRGGKTEVLEGDWKPKRIVVLEFESADRAKEWLNCEEYREPRKMRHRTAKTNMILVEGHAAQ
jgi:uncharacterized protein (DUF1330 family)